MSLISLSLSNLPVLVSYSATLLSHSHTCTRLCCLLVSFYSTTPPTFQISNKFFYFFYFLFFKFLQREFEKSYQNKTSILIFFAVRETNCLQKDLNKTKKKFLNIFNFKKTCIVDKNTQSQECVDFFSFV